MIENIPDVLYQHPQEILLWTNGFFAALALKRSRISAIFDKFLPNGDEETNN